MFGKVSLRKDNIKQNSKFSGSIEKLNFVVNRHNTIFSS